MNRIKIIKTSYWLWILLVIIPFICLIIWSIFGVIYTDAHGRIIILSSPDRVNIITAQYPGVIEKFNVTATEKVKKGQIIAVVDQSELKIQLDHAKESLKRLKEEQKELNNEYSIFKNFSNQYRIAAKKLSDQKISDLESQKAYYQYLNKHEKDLYAKKLLTLPDVKKTEIDLFGVLENMFDTKDRYNSVLLDQENTKISWIERLTEINTQVDQQQMQVQFLNYKYNTAKYIRSPMDGVIDQILVPIGTNIQPSQSIASVSENGKASYALAFLPIDQGKKIQVGAKAYIAPGTVNKNIYGYILGKVERVEEFQSSSQAINAIIVDNVMTQHLEEQDLNFVAWVKLTDDPSTPSGFKWTSKKGPPFIITPGTLGKINVITAMQHPIELFLPFLKTFFDIGDTKS